MINEECFFKPWLRDTTQTHLRSSPNLVKLLLGAKWNVWCVALYIGTYCHKCTSNSRGRYIQQWMFALFKVTNGGTSFCIETNCWIWNSGICRFHIRCAITASIRSIYYEISASESIISLGFIGCIHWQELKSLVKQMTYSSESTPNNKVLLWGYCGKCYT